MSQSRRRESEPERRCVQKMRWSVKDTHNAAIGVHVELEMANCHLGRRNDEEMTRVGPKVDFGQDFEPLERGPYQVRRRRRDWLTLSSSLVGS